MSFRTGLGWAAAVGLVGPVAILVRTELLSRSDLPDGRTVSS